MTDLDHALPARPARALDRRRVVRGLALLQALVLGLLMVLYGTPISRFQLLDDPNVLSPGTVVLIMNYPIRVTLFGVLLLAFTLRAARPAAAARAGRAEAEALAAAARAVLPWLFLLVALGGVREVAQLELFDARYGAGLAGGGVRLEDLLGAATLGAGGGLVLLALARARGGDEEPTAGEGGHGGWLLGGAVLVAFAAARAAYTPEWVAQDRHMEALAMHSLIWQALVAGLALLADDPRRGGPLAWARRNLAVVALLVLLELFRVAATQEQYMELFWYRQGREHIPERLAFFEGDLDRLATLVIRSVLLVVGLVACWLAGARVGARRDVGRRERAPA